MNSLERVLCAVNHRQPDRVPIDFGGACDSQGTLAFGTPQQVAAEVAESLRVFAPGGGFVLAPVHNIQAGVPSENVIALFDAALLAGVYS